MNKVADTLTLTLRPLIVAVSGGIDSTVLAHYLLSKGCDISLAHCNYQLRGAESDGDEAFVRKLADQMGVKVYVKKFDVEKEAQKGESTQMTARRLRYDYFLELLNDRFQPTVLAVAHHADDNLETTLINLIRGTGLNGLAGMEPFSFLPDNHPIFRPFLDVSREEIEAYARKHQLAWREDASNADDKYLRNRIRHQLTPLLAEFGLTGDSFRKTASHLRAAVRFQDTHLGQESLRLMKMSSRGGTVFHREDLPPDEEDARFLLRHIYEEFGFTDEQFRQVFHAKRALTLETERGILRAYIDRIELVVKRDPIIKSGDELIIDTLPFMRRMGERTLVIHNVNSWDVVSDPNCSYFRYSPFPWVIRTRQPGDRFAPSGMNGKTKKLQDFMIDEKIPRDERDNIPLLISAEGEIMAVMGYRISEHFRRHDGDDLSIEIRWI